MYLCRFNYVSMVKRLFITLFCCLLTLFPLLNLKGNGIDSIPKKIKVSGYIQTQIEVAEKDGMTKVGSSTTYNPKYDQNPNFFYRYGIRRGRVKLEMKEKWAGAVFQVNLTDKGLSLRNAYISVYDPWWNMATFSLGIIDRNFGSELTGSSSRRESPERALIVQKLFPEPRDLGAQVMFQLFNPWKTKNETKFKNQDLTLYLSLLSGNGIFQDDNNHLDFLSRIQYKRKKNNWNFEMGSSLYLGKVNNKDSITYTPNLRRPGLGNFWLGTVSQPDSLLSRNYMGFDLAVTYTSNWGETTLKGEYMFGVQPSEFNDFASPEADSYTNKYNYLRTFQGAFAYLVHTWKKVPITAVFKYGYFDPNLIQNIYDINSYSDLRYQSFGFGIVWDPTTYLRFMCYYDYLLNENYGFSFGFPGLLLPHDLKDNILTLRLQYKF